MIEAFSMNFFRNAFIISILLSVIFGILSFFIVMRKMSFLGAGIAHTAFGGVAIGVFLGINPFITALGFCILIAVLLSRLVRNVNISYDTGIGIFFSFSMALGALLISLKKAYTFDLMGYLFGNILGVTSSDVIITAVALTLFMPFVLLFLNRIIFMSFDEDVASVSGVHTAALDTVMIIFLAGIIVVSIKIIGIILVTALVVLPASFGLLLSRRYKRVIIISIIYTLVAMTGGLFISYYLDTPAGATMVTAGTVAYFSAVLIQWIVSRNSN